MFCGLLCFVSCRFVQTSGLFFVYRSLLQYIDEELTLRYCMIVKLRFCIVFASVLSVLVHAICYVANGYVLLGLSLTLLSVQVDPVPFVPIRFPAITSHDRTQQQQRIDDQRKNGIVLADNGVT